MSRNSTLNKQIESHIREIPTAILKKLIKKKLAEQNIEDLGVIDDLTKHILSKSTDEFIWEDGGDTNNKVTITFTEEDAESLSRDTKNFLENDLPTIIQKSVDHGAKLIVQSMEEQWPELKIDAHHEAGHFRDRLELRWAAGLDPLRMMIVASREVGQNFADRLAKSKARKGLFKRQALAILHVRACQTALEIVTLLENGFADGAYARWRTLYEISVVAFVIDRFGDDVAKRYLAHDAISVREFIVNEYKHRGENYDPSALRGHEREIEANFQAALSEFGAQFVGPYGWAAFSLGIKSPKFQDLERAVDWNALPPDYKMSSYKVHAGVAGTVRTIATVSNTPFIFSGATNAGLETPAVNTAYSLLQVTSLIFERLRDLETQAALRSLALLRDKVQRECFKAAKILERDERALRRAQQF